MNVLLRVKFCSAQERRYQVSIPAAPDHSHTVHLNMFQSVCPCVSNWGGPSTTQLK